jgi:hypothetical protein
MLHPQLTAKTPFVEFYKNPIYGSVADTTSQADGHSVYESPSFLLFKQRYKKLQNIAPIIMLLYIGCLHYQIHSYLFLFCYHHLVFFQFCFKHKLISCGYCRGEQINKQQFLTRIR